MKTKFRTIMGNSPEMKILELLMTGRNFEYTKNEIVKGAKVNRSRGFQIIKMLTKKRYLIVASKVAHLESYKLNPKSKEVKLLTRLFDTIIS